VADQPIPLKFSRRSEAIAISMIESESRKTKVKKRLLGRDAVTIKITTI
jgi:hypothetical protein